MICGYTMDQDGTVCMQALGHEDRGVPHLRYEDGAKWWDEWRKQRFAPSRQEEQ